MQGRGGERGVTAHLKAQIWFEIPPWTPETMSTPLSVDEENEVMNSDEQMG